METPTFDADGYPTEETLIFIENYSTYDSPQDLVNFIVMTWHWPDYAIWNPPLLELHTGGWSGNEMLIGALQKSKSLFWLFYWQKSERGGHYYFKIPQKEK